MPTYLGGGPRPQPVVEHAKTEERREDGDDDLGFWWFLTRGGVEIEGEVSDPRRIGPSEGRYGGEDQPGDQ